MSIFEITGDDIALLNDEQLRVLISRLCEAELRRRGFSSSYVTAGGSQDASDGGIDVRVALPMESAIEGWVPRANTGFQVKTQSMQPAAIAAEMRPNGKLRLAIQELGSMQGAYVIVSSRESTTETSLGRRREAMKTAATDCSDIDGLWLEFYDRDRVARWVRSHEGIIPWVREAIGRPTTGWQSYGPWAAPTTEDYLVDDHLLMFDSEHRLDQGLSALRGIQLLRERLRERGCVIRLVGLSGVGKTRFVQAIFDERVGESSLDPSLALYTDMADGPEPQPTALLSRLIAGGTQAILIVDNCPPELHRRLSELCRRDSCQVSLLTIEYDIHEDQPEGTRVVRLEPSSIELIERLLQQRFPGLSGVDARRIADLSGGNARVAIVCAKNLDHGETVACLSDDQLLRRLVFQRNSPDDGLHRTALACSLVYSFEGEDLSEDGELSRLGRIVGRAAHELYRDVAELKRRGLVQQRGIWRAVLPHAVANRLAAAALQDVPYGLIEQQLVTEKTERLLASFSRRLGYLHESEEAVDIAKRWVAPGGLLANLANLTDLGYKLFENAAPLVPGEVLSALETALIGSPPAAAVARWSAYEDILRSLAWEPKLFERAATLMLVILSANATGQTRSRHLFVSLFQLFLSGTHATVEQRLTILAQLLESTNVRHRTLGVDCLRVALESSTFSCSHNFEFGARSRDLGFRPSTWAEVDHWFAQVLKLVEAIGEGDRPISHEVRTVFADKLQNLWLKGYVCECLASTCRSIGRTRFWPEGWRAVQRTLVAHGRAMPEESRDLLVLVESELRPIDLGQRVRAQVLCTNPWRELRDNDDDSDDGADGSDRGMGRAGAQARALGYEVAQDPRVLAAVLPEIVSGNGFVWEFGRGLCAGTEDAEKLWSDLRWALAATEEKQRKPQVFGGFLDALHAKDPILADSLLDRTVEDEALAPFYPSLQTVIPLHDRAIARLRLALSTGKTPASAYECLALGRISESIPDSDLRDLLVALAAEPDGYHVAVEVLYMRLYSARRGEVEAPDALLDAGCILLNRVVFTPTNQQEDHRLGDIARTCLRGELGRTVARKLGVDLRNAAATNVTYALGYEGLLQELFRTQPEVLLEVWFGGETDELEQAVRSLRRLRDSDGIVDVVPEDVLLRWCDGQPDLRYPAIAKVVQSVRREKEGEPLRWTSLALRLLKNAPDPPGVLERYIEQFSPRVWSGSRAAIIEEHAALLDLLDEYPELASTRARAKDVLQKEIDQWRKWETERDHKRDERFEW